MQLPVDIQALAHEATDIKTACETPLSVSVYVDESAPAELVAHVRNAFASSSAHVRMTVTYLDSSFIPHPTDDLAILTAGTSLRVGAAAKAIRAVGVPVMIATLSPGSVAKTAEEEGAAIPEGDIISPAMEGDVEEPVELDYDAATRLNERMGSWVVSVCRDKRLALSIAFPFMRRSLARDAVQITSLQNAGIGLVPFIPGADLPLMTLNQAKMVMQIAAAYGHDLDKDRWKELAAVIGGAYLSRTLARELAEFIPVLGFIIRPSVAYGGTSALGYGLIEYYEGGENATGVANVVSKAGETGMKVVSRAAEIASDPSSIRFDGITHIATVARDNITEYAPRLIELVRENVPVAKETASNVLAAVAGK